MTDPSIFNQLLIWPILNLLLVFYKLFLLVKLPGAFGLAIIALTIFIRLLLSPLTNSQLKSTQKMQQLKPKMDELAAKHGKDKMRLQQEQMKLYKEAGVNPASGCLLVILQMPVFIALYNVFWQILGAGNLGKVVQEINQVAYSSVLRIQSIDMSFFGINLGIKPSAWQTAGWWLLVVPLITAALQWYQTKLMTPPTATSPAIKNKNNDQKKKPEGDMAQVMQGQMSILFPLMIGWFAFSFPIGLALYWNTFSILGIIQQMQMNKGK
ncbi:MAG: YidC/Oxa1 family membrane protein insertase [Candidatus Gottesmanbacteria bacterium]